ncbi:FAD-dependent oxidoreductase [Streptomyces sp. A7024]|uniref:FAD-dependent oxidoreductase n=1 Tax=Streptomyces coryli TaxID=1128680 RepID=A0A6G4UEV4_9ACTN|nr:FAD-dependent monooxygenase [Streptomyces coryli]NGN70248.1 FAD-dependent oxidoreductase [Streptomyces coryli]
MAKQRVLISGASVAGPTLAYWLHRQGYDVTLVERAPALRDSGYAVDFRGEAFDVLEQMGILGEVRGHDTQMKGTSIVDGDGQQTGELPAEAFAGGLEVLKREFTAILHRVAGEVAEIVFDDSIASLEQDDSGVRVTFERGAERVFDYVVGADGVYSNVRKLAFGPHQDYVHHLGMSGAGFSTSNHLGLDHRGVLCSTPGRAVYLFSAGDADRMTVSLSFGTDTAEIDRFDAARQQEIVHEHFAGAEWIVPQLLDDMAMADDFYFASACQVEAASWSSGRVVLVGDAGYCAAPTSGMGTSQALIGARLLANRLAEADGDYAAAFAAYERELRPYTAENQAHGREAVKMFGG